MPSVGCRLSIVGCQMRLSRRSDAILSRFVHQSFDVGTRTEITVLVCENGCFSRTGTIPVAPIRASIVFCANRDNMSISGLAVFRRFCLSGYVDFENWFCPGSQKWAEIAYRDNDFCPGRNVNRLTFSPGQIRAQRRGRGAPQWRWASLWLEANSRPGTMGRGPGRRSRA